MKIPLLIFIMLTCQLLTAQIVAGKDDVEERNFYYSDTANGEFAFGDYDPKDMIKLEDGSLLIGTELRIHFPSSYKSPEKLDSLYWARHEIFMQKTHVSSGTVIKLNPDMEKEWETVFSEKRVEKILKTTDGRILIVGEEVTMKYVWMVELGPEGNIIRENRYTYKNKVTIANAIIDEHNDVYLLLESSHIVPVKTRKDFGKRYFYFFRDSEMNSHIAVAKVNSDGKLKWLKPVDKRAQYIKFGHELVVNNELVFSSFWYSGFEKDSLIEGEKAVQLSKSGKRKSAHNITQQYMLFFDNGLVTITSHSQGRLLLFRSGAVIDSIQISSADNDVRISHAIQTPDGYLILAANHDNNRDYLLISLSPDLKFKKYWTYPRDEYNEICGAVRLDSGETILVGKCYRKEEGGEKRLVTYINLVKIKSGAE